MDQLLELQAVLQGFTRNLEIVASIRNFAASRLGKRSCPLPDFEQLEYIITASTPILEKCEGFLEKHTSTVQKRGLGKTLKFHLDDAQSDLKELRSKILSMTSQLNTAILTISL